MFLQRDSDKSILTSSTNICDLYEYCIDYMCRTYNNIYQLITIGTNDPIENLITTSGYYIIQSNKTIYLFESKVDAGWFVNGINNVKLEQFNILDDNIKNRSDPTFIARDGTKLWYNKYGELHNDNDLPAVIWGNGTQEWYNNGILHRDNDFPARMSHDGVNEWYKNGLRHRDNDEPAIIDTKNNDRQWYINGKCSRLYDSPAIIQNDGNICKWVLNDVLHRDSFNSNKTPNPALIMTNNDGVLTHEWYKHGVQFEPKITIFDEESNTQSTKDINYNLHSFNDEPAVVRYESEKVKGIKIWYNHGKIHRGNDKPAVIHSDGTKEWYIDGKCNRLGNKPALITSSGRTIYLNK